MSKRHYFIGQFNWSDTSVNSHDSEMIHQIKDVLKINIGEEVVLCDGEGKAVIATLRQMDKKDIKFSVIKLLPPKNIGRNVVLCAAILKRDNFEWLLQKAVEVGVDEIVPLISERTVKIGSNEKRWQKIIKEAAEQSERQTLPKLHSTLSFKEALKIKNGKAVLFDPSGESFAKVNTTENMLTVFIGPEGGWSDSEIKQAKEAKCEVANLGETILRGETAGIVAVYLVKNHI